MLPGTSVINTRMQSPMPPSIRFWIGKIVGYPAEERVGLSLSVGGGGIKGYLQLGHSERLCVSPGSGNPVKLHTSLCKRSARQQGKSPQGDKVVLGLYRRVTSSIRAHLTFCPRESKRTFLDVPKSTFYPNTVTITYICYVRSWVIRRNLLIVTETKKTESEKEKYSWDDVAVRIIPTDPILYSFSGTCWRLRGR